MSQELPCIYRVLEGPVKEFVLTEVSRRAVDALFDTAEKVMSEAVLNSDLLALVQPSLIDSGIGLQPLNHSLHRLRLLLNKFPESRKSFMAVILPAGPLLKTLSVMTRPIAPIRLYTPQEREQALAWLRASIEAKH
jgi:hypothetical protein